MSKARNISNLFSASTDVSTDAEVASAISTHSSAADPHTVYAPKSGPSFTGTVLINTTSSGYPKLQVNNNTDPLNLSWDGATAAFRDQRTMTTGVGGSIIFEGNYLTAGGMAAYGGIRASKANSTSGNAQGNLDLWTRAGDIRFYRSEQTIGTDNSNPAFRIMSSGNFYLKSSNPTTELTISAYNDEAKQQKIVADNEVMKFYSLSPNGPGFYWYTGTNTGGVAGAALRFGIDNSGNTGVWGGKSLYFNNPINTGSGSIYCAGGGSLTLASYNQPMITLHEDSEIRFFVGTGTQRAVINNAGELLIGYTSDNGAYKLQVNSQIFATSSSIATSDGRYKENVETITSGLDIVDSLRPVAFDWKEHAVHNFPEGKTVGFIAQEVQEALAGYEWVNNIIKTNYNEEADEEFLGIAESNIIPLLVAAVKELKAEVNELRSLIND